MCCNRCCTKCNVSYQEEQTNLVLVCNLLYQVEQTKPDIVLSVTQNKTGCLCGAADAAAL